MSHPKAKIVNYFSSSVNYHWNQLQFYCAQLNKSTPFCVLCHFMLITYPVY